MDEARVESEFSRAHTRTDTAQVMQPQISKGMGAHDDDTSVLRDDEDLLLSLIHI